MFFYKLFRFILKPIFMIYYNPKIIDRHYLSKDYIGKKESFVVAGNHQHVMDQCITIVSTRRPIRYMAKDDYFKGPMSWFFKLGKCIPVNRDIKDVVATNIALDTLKNGGAVGIFPEGTRNKTDDFLLPFKFGAVSMADKTDSYLVPFGVTGEFKFRSKDLIMRYGKPFKIGDMTYEEANDRLYNEVKKLMEINLGI